LKEKRRDHGKKTGLRNPWARRGVKDVERNALLFLVGPFFTREVVERYPERGPKERICLRYKKDNRLPEIQCPERPLVGERGRNLRAWGKRGPQLNGVFWLSKKLNSFPIFNTRQDTDA